jgi:hypothetical protein
VRHVDLSAGLREQLEGSGMQGLALEVRGEKELADAALSVLADHGERVGPLRGCRLVDQPDDLDRLLHLQVAGHVDEHSAGPEGGRAGGELVALERHPLPEVLANELAVLLDRLLERHHRDALVGHVGVDHARAALNDQRRVLVVAEVELRQARLVAPGLEGVELEAPQ